MPRRVNGWRLDKTLKRKTSFRPISDDDLKYIWAAHRKGALASMGETFAEGDLAPDAFRGAFTAELLTNYSDGWTLLAGKPIGFVLAFPVHHNPALSPFQIVGDIVWFPWASPRNRVEAAVRFFNEMRKERALVEYARAEHRKFFEMLAKHGVMRRVGTTYNVYPGEATTVFETRQWH